MRKTLLFFFLFTALFAGYIYAEPREDLADTTGSWSQRCSPEATNNPDATRVEKGRDVSAASLEIDPGDALGRLQSGEESPVMEKYQLAQQNRDSAVSNKLPFNFLNGVYMSRCMESSRSGDFKSAIEACSKAIELDPANSLAYGLRSYAYLGMGNRKLAVKDCETAANLGDNACEERLKQPAEAENKSEKKNMLRLLCRVSFADGAPQDYSFTIDLNSHTVNGWNARITDDTIYWTQEDASSRVGSWFEIHRYTGVFRGTNTDGSATYAGKCVKAEEKQF